ncbi:DUF3987 domain-containing protein [Desulfolutivibrio sulfoxidireducens]|uniref:DUF3987 domain-containing protein n=1 Tax=Desulfolutivibrio sulfoxidireducens TaxID=2773299 RepID=UPI00159DBCD8|nr:DUF3987 domain-containing protein [Desulfolutivibrio sulfoxidireducens]QLA20885.1 DUF3987 domain-containing protein [Desulfolutivibrio sulfoxidireducens]
MTSNPIRTNRPPVDANCLTAALAACEAGLSVLPTRKDTKAPLTTWKAYQERQASQPEIERWFSAPDTALALVCGRVSGNLEMLDFDLKGEAFAAWADVVKAEAPGLFERLVIERSQSGGRHAAYRCPDMIIPGNRKLAMRAIHTPDDAEVEIDGKRFKPRRHEDGFLVELVLIETRGEGGYFLCAPTPGYELIQGDFNRLPQLSPMERDILIHAAKAVSEWTRPAEVHGLGRGIPQDTPRQPGQDFNDRGDVRALLASHGWTSCGMRGANEQWRRPGKTTGISASLLGGRVFHCFSSNAAPFDPDQSYSPFAVYTLLTHGGQYHAAAKALAAQGFGNAPNGRPQTSNTATAQAPISRSRAPLSQSKRWELARRRFPRIAFPWDIFPTEVAASLQQLARSCATSPTPLPAQAFCMVAGAVGRKLMVGIKDSWQEPLIFWAADIRDSGAGKTPPMWAMAKEIARRQDQEHERYKAENASWERLSIKDRRGRLPPDKPRGYFSTNLTLEGVHAQLDGHPTGGMIILLNELSALISGQNQYKSGGTDRESWLCLHDGKPTRIVRAKESILITDARVQVCGGIQPGIFSKVFGGENGQFIDDGTVFRCLFTYEPSNHHALTEESWSQTNRQTWDTILSRAFDWADKQDKPFHLTFPPKSQARYFGWRNTLDVLRPDLPAPFSGFLPKAYGYAVRLAGVIHAISALHSGEDIPAELSREAMEHSMMAIHFYLAQAVDALSLLLHDGEAARPTEVSSRTILLANVLLNLAAETDNGRLAVKHVQNAYNREATPQEHVPTPRALGSMLRACGLNITTGKHDANGHRACRCLIWDEQTTAFLENIRQSLHCQQTLAQHGFLSEDMDFDESA